MDEKIGRLLAALGDPGDPASLRSRTVIVRTSDHGELGLSHGGLRQKMFNAYEETIRVPLVVSNPALFPRRRDERRAGLAGRPRARRSSASPAADAAATSARFDGCTTSAPRRCAASRRRASATRCCSPTTTTRPATAFQEAPGQPNRIRCVRDERWKYAVYLDPSGRAAPEYELYDLETDPDEALNLVDKRTGVAARARGGAPRAAAAAAALAERASGRRR